MTTENISDLTRVLCSQNNTFLLTENTAAFAQLWRGAGEILGPSRDHDSPELHCEVTLTKVMTAMSQGTF